MYLIKEKQYNFENNENIYVNFKNKISKYNFENSKIEIYIFTPKKKAYHYQKKIIQKLLYIFQINIGKIKILFLVLIIFFIKINFHLLLKMEIKEKIFYLLNII